MQLLEENNGLQYEIFDVDRCDKTALMVADAFTRYEPMILSMNVSKKEFAELVRLLTPKLAAEELSVVSIEKGSEQIVGSLIASDFAILGDKVIKESYVLYSLQKILENFKIKETFDPALALLAAIDGAQILKKPGHFLRFIGAISKFEPILALLNGLENQYRKEFQINIGECLYIFLLAASDQRAGEGIAENLTRVCLDNAQKKGYRAAVVEATSSASQHIMSKLGFITRYETSYTAFSYKGRRVFEGIKAPKSAMFMEKVLFRESGQDAVAV